MVKNIRDIKIVPTQARNEDPAPYNAAPTGAYMDGLSNTLDSWGLSSDDLKVVSRAANILRNAFDERQGTQMINPSMVRAYLQTKLALEQQECFGVILLDNQHCVIADCVVFIGTIDSTPVYPREVVKLALKHNAAAVLYYHNHPSGDPEPSQADRNITDRLRAALDLIDVRSLDHIVVGMKGTCSFAERGWI